MKDLVLRATALFNGQHDAAPFPLSNGVERPHGPRKEKHGSKNTWKSEQDHPSDPCVVRAVVCAVVEIFEEEKPVHVEDGRWRVRTR